MVRPKTASKKRRGSFKQKSTSKRFRGSGVAMVPALLRSSPDGINIVDTSNQTLALDSTGTVLLLNGLVPGTSENQRLGRKITMKSILIRWGLIGVASGAPANEHDRMLLVYDRQSNGAAPTWADVIQSIDTASTTSSRSYDMPNPSNKERFAIIRDFKWNFPRNAGGASQFQDMAAHNGTSYMTPHEGVEYVRLKGLETHFNTGTAGTVADIQTGGLFLMSMGNLAAANNQYDVDVFARVSFTP